MKTDPVRKFRLADVLILMAATAVSLAVSRQLLHARMYLPPARWLFSWNSAYAWGIWIENVVFVVGPLVVCPILAGWTVACLAMRCTGPSLSWRIASRRPGTMASLAATASFGLSAVVSTSARLGVGQMIDTSDWSHRELAFATTQAGLAVFWCWATMVLIGRWCPQPSWFDRTGRALGWSWISLGFLFLFSKPHIRRSFIRILPGDKVKIEVSRYDSTRGRIIYRLRNKNSKD